MIDFIVRMNPLVLNKRVKASLNNADRVLERRMELLRAEEQKNK